MNEPAWPYIVKVPHDLYRRLADGCDECNLSLNACAASKSMNREPCCPRCSHG